MKRKPKSSGTGGDDVRAPPAPAGSVDAHQLLDLWFALARFDWSCLVVAPASAGSADELAKSLADTGQHLSDHPVSAVTLKVLGPASVRALMGLVARFREGQQGATWPPPVSADLEKLLMEYVDEPEEPLLEGEPVPEWPKAPAGPRPDGDGPRGERQAAVPLPSGKLIIAIPSVLTEPLGIAVARAADGVVLTVELGRTRLADAERSAELIGREHLVGTCVLSD